MCDIEYIKKNIDCLKKKGNLWSIKY